MNILITKKHLAKIILILLAIPFIAIGIFMAYMMITKAPMISVMLVLFGLIMAAIDWALQNLDIGAKS